MIATNEAEVVDAVRDARERRRTLEIVGAGTKRAFGRPTQCDEILDVASLRGIVSYEPEELLLTVLPGTPVAEINELLAANKQRLGFDPSDWGPLLGAKANAGTIGGAISADVCGSAAVRYGRARDQLLGYRAVNGFGEAYKAGGKVVKNVTGFDLPKLMCGAMGTLGVLTEVTLRVFPKPSLSKVFAINGLAPAAGFALLRRIWSSPLEATGLACINETAFIRLEGEQQPLAEKEALLRTLAGDAFEVDDGNFRQFGDGAPVAAAPHDVWLLSLPPANASDAIHEIGAHVWFGDRAGGVIWIGVANGDRSMHDIAMRHGGSAKLLRASENTRSGIAVFPPEGPARAALTRAVKAAFDPLGLFNPGRMYEGI
jgi:glycolate dehydrogenase FAD-binding subunit